MFMLPFLVLPVPLLSVSPPFTDLIAPDVGLFLLILDVLLLSRIILFIIYFMTSLVCFLHGLVCVALPVLLFVCLLRSPLSSLTVGILAFLGRAKHALQILRLLTSLEKRLPFFNKSTALERFNSFKN